MTRIGIVGCGFVSSLYMKTLGEYEEFKLVGAYDNNPGRLATFCDFYNTRSYDSLQAITADVDLIVNLTTPQQHFAVSSYVLGQGKAVYSEKPFTTSEQDSQKLVNIAIENNTNVLGAPCGHLSEMAETVAHHLSTNPIGKIYAVYAEMDDGMMHNVAYEKWRNEFGIRWPGKNEFETGSTLEHAGYTICVLQKWFGKAKIKSVVQHRSITDKIIPLHKETSDFSCAVLEYADNIIARVTCSVIAPKDRQIRIFGEEGVITVGDIWKYNAPVKIQKMITIRRKTLLSPIKRTLKPVETSYPQAPKTAAAQMDFCRGIRQLAELKGSDHQLMQNYLDVNSIVATMNGDSVVRKQHPWIILGTGNMAVKMGECLRRNAYPINAVYSETGSRAQDVCHQLNVANSYTTLEEIPVATEKTIAYVASVNAKHYTQVKTLLSKGYDVLCEKPLTMMASQTEELYGIAADKGLQLQENLWSLFLPSAPKIKKQIESHQHLELSFCSPLPYSPDSRQWQPSAGGCLYDLGIYPLAWAVYFLGEITGYTVNKTTVKHGIVCELKLTTTHTSGKTATIKAGFSKTRQYIKAGREYFTPIYAPEFKSKININLVRKVREKLLAPEYPAKDPYAFILNQLNDANTDHPYPVASSIHVAQIMEGIHRQIRPAPSKRPINTSAPALAETR